MSESDTHLEGYYFIIFYYIVIFYYIKAFGIYYPSIVGEGVFHLFDVPRGEGFNDFRWNPTGDEGGQENTILKGMSKMYGSY